MQTRIALPFVADSGALAVAICAIPSAFLVFFIARGAGLEPVVFADEWTHSVNARLLPFSQVSNPSYLYYFIYRATNACGYGFLDCARLLNIVFFAASSLLFFLYALRFVPMGFAAALLLVFLGSPNNVYVLFFSPDSLFGSAFVIFFMSLLLLDNVRRAIISGALLGLLALIKINAIFLLPGLFLFFLVEHWIIRRDFVGFIVNSALLLFSFAAAKALIGFLIAGWAGLSITGQQYAGIAAAGLDFSNVIARLPLFAFSIGGYLAAAVMLLGVPLVSILLLKRRSDQHGAGSDSALGLAAISLLIPLIFVVGLFAAITSDLGPYESVRRLGLRYISFMLPFFYLFGAAVLVKADYADVASVRTKIATLIAMIATAAMIFVLSTYYLPNIVDSPELAFVAHSWLSLAAGSVFLLLPLILILLRPALAARGYIASLLLLALLWNAVGLRELRFLRTPTPFDAAGRYAALFLGPERANVAVLSSDIAGLFRTMFHLNAVGPIGVQVTAATTREDLIRQLQNKKWVLLVGADALKFAPANTSAPAGFALVLYDTIVRPSVGSR